MCTTLGDCKIFIILSMLIMLHVHPILHGQYLLSYRSEEANAESSESRACGTDAWSAIQAKLAPAVSRSARNEGVSEASNSKEGPIRSPVLSLQAIDTGPRLRLLAYSVEHLRKEAGIDPTRPPFSVSWRVTIVQSSTICNA